MPGDVLQSPGYTVSTLWTGHLVGLTPRAARHGRRRASRSRHRQATWWCRWRRSRSRPITARSSRSPPTCVTGSAQPPRFVGAATAAGAIEWGAAIAPHGHGRLRRWLCDPLLSEAPGCIGIVLSARIWTTSCVSSRFQKMIAFNHWASNHIVTLFSKDISGR